MVEIHLQVEITLNAIHNVEIKKIIKTSANDSSMAIFLCGSSAKRNFQVKLNNNNKWNGNNNKK